MIFSTVSLVSSSSMICPRGLRRRRLRGDPLRGGVLAADLLGLDADIAEALTASSGLLLGAHDRLQRRIARLVDRVADGDDRGQLDLRRCRTRTRPGARSAARLRLDVHLDHLRQRGHPQVLGHDGADRVALAVVGLLAEQHEVGALALRASGPARSRWPPRPSRRPPRRRDGRSGRRRARRPCAGRAPRCRGPSSRRRSPRRATAPPSRICIAASIACVSYGFRFFSPLRSMRPVEGSMRFSTAASGTSLTRTHIFIRGYSLGVLLDAILLDPAVD